MATVIITGPSPDTNTQSALRAQASAAVSEGKVNTTITLTVGGTAYTGKLTESGGTVEFSIESTAKAKATERASAPKKKAAKTVAKKAAPSKGRK